MKLQKAAGALMSRSHEGIIEQLFFPLTPDLDHEKNADSVAKVSYGLLRGEIDYSFG